MTAAPVFSAAETDDSRYFLAGADLLSAYGRGYQVMAALRPSLLLSR